MDNFCHHLQRFKKALIPIYDITEKGKKLQLTEECQKTFDHIMQLPVTQ